GALVAENRDFYLVTEAESDDAVKAILHALCKIGLTRVRGIFRPSVLHDWKTRRGALETVPQVDVAAVEALAGANGAQIVDVRSPEEWSRGHLPGALHIPLALLPDRFAELDASAPIVVHCKGGNRSSIAASFLQSQGLSNISNLAGGYDHWVAQGLAIESARR